MSEFNEDATLRVAGELLHSLASHVRMGIVRLLEHGPLCVHNMTRLLSEQGLSIAQPLVSQHLKILREANVVTATPRGRETFYALTDYRAARIVAEAIEVSALLTLIGD